jgi:hypothetical protein
MRDKEMLEKLATHDVQDASGLFSLADKCAKAAEGHAWHSQPTPEAGKNASPMQVPLPKAMGKRRRRRPATSTSRWPVLPPLQLQRVVGVVARVVTSTHTSHPIVTMVASGARCTTSDASTPRSVGRSRSLRNNSTSSRSSSHVETAHLLNIGRASRRLSRRMTRTRRWNSRMPRGH